MYLNINLSDAVMEPEDKSSSLEQFCAEEFTKEQVPEEIDKSNETIETLLRKKLEGARFQSPVTQDCCACR